MMRNSLFPGTDLHNKVTKNSLSHTRKLQKLLQSLQSKQAEGHKLRDLESLISDDKVYPKEPKIGKRGNHFLLQAGEKRKGEGKAAGKKGANR